ncbi:hypothetical protein K3495_g14710 [Podosphaera aphanis]|nr:hypothetical protein K3495_g14710 [Podosphaera aphanis]
MEEKGFLIEKSKMSHRIFTKELYDSEKLVKNSHDRNREKIAVISTIYADGSKLSPALIYKATTSGI